jgi:hypothetical protein
MRSEVLLRQILVTPSYVRRSANVKMAPNVPARRILLSKGRDSPDEFQTGINVRVFPALLQDRREVLTAISTSGNLNA